MAWSRKHCTPYIHIYDAFKSDNSTIYYFSLLKWQMAINWMSSEFIFCAFSLLFEDKEKWTKINIFKNARYCLLLPSDSCRAQNYFRRSNQRRMTKEKVPKSETISWHHYYWHLFGQKNRKKETIKKFYFSADSVFGAGTTECQGKSYD